LLLAAALNLASPLGALLHADPQVACFLNLAQCALKEESFGEALSFCNKALE
jgi:hypothetical protein